MTLPALENGVDVCNATDQFDFWHSKWKIECQMKDPHPNSSWKSRMRAYSIISLPTLPRQGMRDKGKFCSVQSSADRSKTSMYHYHWRRCSTLRHCRRSLTNEWVSVSGWSFISSDLHRKRNTTMFVIRGEDQLCHWSMSNWVKNQSRIVVEEHKDQHWSMIRRFLPYPQEIGEKTFIWQIWSERKREVQDEGICQWMFNTRWRLIQFERMKRKMKCSILLNVTSNLSAIDLANSDFRNGTYASFVSSDRLGFRSAWSTSIDLFSSWFRLFFLSDLCAGLFAPFSTIRSFDSRLGLNASEWNRRNPYSTGRLPFLFSSTSEEIVARRSNERCQRQR